MGKETQKAQPATMALIDLETGIIPSTEALKEVLMGLEELGDEIRISDLGTVAIGGGGSGTFKVREPGAEEPESGVKAVEGVIIAHHRVNIRWARPFSERGDDERPACKSVDGVTGISAAGEVIDCETCPYNRFGEDGERKACSNKHQLYILRAGELFPVLMSLPPSALKAWRNFTLHCLTKPRVPVHRVLTRITLKNLRNPQKIEYSVPVFEAVALLPESTAEQLKAFGASLKAQLQKARLVADEDMAPARADAPAAAGEGGFIRVDESEMPF